MGDIAKTGRHFSRNPHDCMLHMQTELILSQGQSANAHARHDAVEALVVAIPPDPLCAVPPPGTSDSEPPATFCVLCDVSGRGDWSGGCIAYVDWSWGGAYSSDLTFRWQTPTHYKTGTGLSLDPCTCVQSSPQDRLLLSCSGDVHLTSQTDTSRQSPPNSHLFLTGPTRSAASARRLGHETWLVWKGGALLYRFPEYRRNIAILQGLPSRPVSFWICGCGQPTAPPFARGSPHETCFLKHAAVDMVLEEQVLTAHGEELHVL
jgi:hypothetical protein